MTEVISIVSQKGGCGKTTTALNLSLSLAEAGHKTLLCDVDPQGSVGHSLRKQDFDLVGLCEVLAGDCAIRDALTETKQPNLVLLCRGRLDPADVCLYELELYEHGKLGPLLAEIRDDFDFIILDTPSGLGLSTRAALDASDSALVPLQAEPLALRTIEQVLRVIESTRASRNADLVLLGILPTMLDKSQDHSLNVLLSSWSELAGVFETTIPREPVFGHASEQGVPLAYLGGALSPEAKRFHLLASEVCERVQELRGTQGDPDERPQRALL